MPKVLATSVRFKRGYNIRTFIFLQCSLALALLNLIFVVMATISDEENSWLGNAFFPLGYSITLISMVDVLTRYSTGRICYFLPRLKLDFLFDGVATAAAITSVVGR